MSGRRFKVLLRTVVSCIFLSLASVHSAFAIDPAKLAEAQTIIDRAEKVSSLTGANAVPFFLELRFDHTPFPATGKGGSYKLWWTARDKWRAEAESGDLREVEIRNEQGLWLTENTNPKLDAIFSGTRRFPFAGQILGWNEHIVGLHERKIKGVNFSCVATEQFDVQREFCFDPQSGALTQTSERVPVGTSLVVRQLEPMEYVIEYRQYSGVGDKILPGEIRISTEGQVAGLIRLVSVALAPKKPFAADMFVVPEGYRMWPGCDQYQAAKAGRNFWRQAPGLINHDWFSGGGKLADAVRITVGPDGKAQEVQLIDPVGQPSKRVESAFMSEMYEPAICDGKPVAGMLLMNFVRQ